MLGFYKANVMKKEIWKAVIGFPLYEVSTMGRVRSLSRTYYRKHHLSGTRVAVKTSERILNGWKREQPGRGYIVTAFVALRRNNQTHMLRLHRVVLEAFCGPCPDGMEGCHNDGNPENNHINNLRWDTHVANIGDEKLHGTQSPPPRHIGDSHPRAKLTTSQIEKIRNTLMRRGTTASLAREYGISATHVARIINGKGRVAASSLMS